MGAIVPFLEMDQALKIAEALTTIGHPYAKSALQATASDLVAWCHGAFRDNRMLTPLDQALELVDEARNTWLEGWPERGGTAKLRELFFSRYASAEDQEQMPGDVKPLTVQESIARGLVAQRCQYCALDEVICAYGGARVHKRYIDFWENPEAKATDPEKVPALARFASTPKAPVTRENLEEMLRAEARFRAQHQQRRSEQMKAIEERYDDGYRL